MQIIYKILIFPFTFMALFGVLSVFSGKMASGIMLIAPVVVVYILLVSHIKADKSTFFQKVEKFGPPKYQDYNHSTGIAVTSNQKLVLATGKKTKSYDFRDVRQWRISIQNGGVVLGGGVNGAILNGMEAKRAAGNTGLFVSVRDIENPEWHIRFVDKAMLNKWYEILQQEINERNS